MNDLALDVEGFGGRTTGGRAAMRDAVALMDKAILDGTDADLAAGLRGLTVTYRTKIGAFYALAEAVAGGDAAAAQGALNRWEAAIGQQRSGTRALLEAARPFLSSDEQAGWEAALGV